LGKRGFLGIRFLFFEKQFIKMENFRVRFVPFLWLVVVINQTKLNLNIFFGIGSKEWLQFNNTSLLGCSPLIKIYK
jgi:hypothetical protein